MKLLELKHKLEKGESLGGEVIYIKEDNILYGIECLYEDRENEYITLLKSKEESVKVCDFLNILNELYANIGDKDVFIGEKELNRSESKEIKSVEFAQYELMKMLFINI
ncbi:MULTISPECIES: hypothetical protein [Romboutsia]|uniref:Uncharacterized protein n=1 Tax=Romboutsia hominis TaxID=1507512 RepID=A0A2P2BT40_9FIRM|nr:MULTISPECIES: hypothetical protein [Romboutsia]MCH1960782.1 hypothetical protein [Romboutsia hominis]MCH1968784.1 hypothetical protein [Romboutsia hominis]MDB8789890.1 hypothetical protein [Romboutsia sp. 1001216sp1]MDB8793696.1 hypothetical protein [Romboutsia sp. 1001216sp1]MDB8795093.1 hypothetical protein [Romboutsia sp. 1001216sp1]